MAPLVFYGSIYWCESVVDFCLVYKGGLDESPVRFHSASVFDAAYFQGGGYLHRKYFKCYKNCRNILI